MTAPTALRDAGMAEAEHAADPRLSLMIDRHIAAMNASGLEWSCNDIRDAFPVVSSGLVGARVRAAATRRPREMVPVGYTPSTLDSTHAHPIRTWRGVR